MHRPGQCSCQQPPQSRASGIFGSATFARHRLDRHHPLPYSAQQTQFFTFLISPSLAYGYAGADTQMAMAGVPPTENRHRRLRRQNRLIGTPTWRHKKQRQAFKQEAAVADRTSSVVLGAKARGRYAQRRLVRHDKDAAE